MKSIATPLLAAGLLLAVAGTATAAQPWMGGRMDTGLYLGAGVGASESDIDTGGFTGSVDKSDTGWKIFGGYQFSRHFAVEAGYYDLGKVSFSGTAGGAAISGNFDSTAIGLSLVGILPVWDNFSLLGRVGVGYSEQDGSVTVAGATATASDDSTKLTYGLGLRYDFGRHVMVRGQWERFRVGGSNVGGEEDVDLYTIDLGYRF